MSESFDPREFRVVAPRGFANLKVGETFRSPSRTVTDAHFSMFQALSGDNHPIHYDIEYCRARGYPGVLAHGLQVLCFTAAGAGTFAHEIGDALIAFTEQSAKFLKPVYPELRPWHVIQIIRILDEAVTNAVKHAEARRITVSIETLNDTSSSGCGCMTVEDDGKGFPLASSGVAAAERQAARGLRNMRSRAASCGAAFELVSGAGGTSVRLTLPRRFPDGDAVAS